MTRPSRAQSLMRIRARRRICEVLCVTLEMDIGANGSAWVDELVNTGVERGIIVAVAEEIAQQLRGIARSVRS